MKTQVNPGRRIMRWIIMSSLLAIILLLIAHFGIYSPLRNYPNDVAVFNDLISLTVPNSTEVQISKASDGKPFGIADQPFEIYSNRFYIGNETPIFMKGTFHYRFGNLKAELDDHSNPTALTPQTYFIEASKESSDTLWKDTSFQDNSYYVLWFGLKNSYSLSTLIEKYPELYLTRTDNRVLSTAIRTSDNNQELTLFMPGNGTQFYQGMTNIDMISTEKEYVSYFNDALQNLTLNTHITNKFLNSGIFENIKSIDLEKKYQYFQEHGANGIGFVVYIDTNMINNLKKDNNLFLLHIEKAQ